MSTNNQPVIGGIVFSLVDDTVWANWPGKKESVELGDCATVTYMMRDFLAQCDLGELLASRLRSNG